MNHLHRFIQSLGQHVRHAQHACHGRWPGTRIGALEVALAATVESVGPCGGLALRLGGEPRAGERLHRLSIDVPGREEEVITVRFDGDWLGHYGQDSHGPSH